MVCYKSRFCRLMFIAFSAICIIFLSNCSGNKPEPDPDIIGKWVTEEPRYAGRFIEISRDFLFLGTGESSPDVYAITEIHISEQENARSYSIVGKTSDGNRFNFEFRLEKKGAVPTLYFKNQAAVEWHKST